MQNEAHARIKINKLLEEADWRFFDGEDGNAKYRDVIPVYIKDYINLDMFAA